MAFSLPNITPFTAPWGSGTSNSYGQTALGAAGNILGGLAPAQAQGFQGYAQGLAGLGTSYANNYGSYASALGNVAQAQGNAESNKYGSRAMAEAARQGAIGSLGSAALGAYGSAANSAMSAWANNQMAYNKSLSEMQQANQQGMSNYGVSRNQALGNLASAYADAGGRLGAAGVLGDMDFSFGDGGGGFSASGAGGQIASGSYGGGGSGRMSLGGGSALSGIADSTFFGLGGTRESIMDGSILSALERDSQAGRKQLDDQHYSSRGMPYGMMDQALGGLLTLSRDGYGTSTNGMNQFYGSVERAEAADRTNRPDYSTIMGGLASGYLHSGDQITGLRGDLGAGYQDFRGDVGSMFNSDPVTDMRQAREAELLRRQYADEDRRQKDAADAQARQAAAENYRRMIADGWEWGGATGGWMRPTGRRAAK